MSDLHFIILMVVLGLYVLGSLIQTFKFAKGEKFFMVIFFFFFSLIVQIFVSPFTWMTYFLNNNVHSYRYTLSTHTPAKRAALEGLGFVYSEHRVSSNNLPYQGYQCWIGNTKLVIALDNEFSPDRKQYMRLSVEGRQTPVVKYMINRIKDINTSLEKSDSVN